MSEYFLNILNSFVAGVGLTMNFFYRKMFTTSGDKSLQNVAKSIIPRLSERNHKGQMGRIGIVGGSEDYTGAPYFAGMSALRIGADLVHIFCHSKAAPVIKSYSPDLIVHPILDKENVIESMKPWIGRLHCLVIGPGLGRDPGTGKIMKAILNETCSANIPTIIDADGLYLLSCCPKAIVNNKNVILTPNVMEYRNFIEKHLKAFKDTNITILIKDAEDRVHLMRTREVIILPPGGSNRRCGGQGDILSGALAILFSWALSSNVSQPDLAACTVACALTKRCNELAYKKHGRGMLASDMLLELNETVRSFE